MLETRDEETGEIIKQLVDKVRRRKVTRLKKAILAARLMVKQSRQARSRPKKPDEDGFETVSEESSSSEDDEFEDREEPRKSIFGNLDLVCRDILASLSKHDSEPLEPQPPLQDKQKPQKIREYVDVKLSKQLDDLTVALLMKLKELYYKRKLKPLKGKMITRPPKKRYIIGISEVQKHLNAGNLTAVILATNMEKVECEKGIDQIVA